MPETLSFDQLIGEPTDVPIPEPPINIDDWEITIHEEFEKGKTGLVFINVQEKKINTYIHDGVTLKKIKLDKLKEVVDSNPAGEIHPGLDFLYDVSFKTKVQITCKNFVSSQQSANANEHFIEPPGYWFEWPNITPTNGCMFYSDKTALKPCVAPQCQMQCKVYEPDNRVLFTYTNTDEENKMELEVRRVRYGFGNEIRIITSHTGAGNFSDVFSPTEVSEISVVKNLNTAEESIVYFGEDYLSVFEKVLMTKLDDLTKEYGELIKEITPDKEIQTEYFSYVRSAG